MICNKKKIWKINSFEIKISFKNEKLTFESNIGESFYSNLFRTLKMHAQSRVELENIFFSQAMLRVKITLKGIHL